ncbi:unnamed protein product [Clonostachys rhizophaga]|uniref:Zn(2)-C6 fungal-type domain-containing protein n=1 Tax=Clonostachys rhizophaga TaxID=160324 RepID=A0A9N9YQ43_9HYPO|nr:unnamed protein product [Clonostachys rhizophaga]
MSRGYPGPPPDYGPGYGNPEYAHPHDGVAQSRLPSSTDPNLRWYMDPSLPNSEYATNPHMHGGPGSQSLSGFAGEKRRNKLGYHRTSVACNHCRRRKIRCIPSPHDFHGRCTNCIRLKKECSFIPTDQQASEAQSGSLDPHSDGGIASNTSSPGPPGMETNSDYSSHVHPAFRAEPSSPWSQPDDRNPNISRGGMHSDSRFDFGDQTSRGYAPTSQNSPMHLGATNNNEHWRRQHSGSTTNDPGQGRPFVPGTTSRQDLGWRGPLPPAAVFGDKATGSSGRVGNPLVRPGIDAIPSSAPNYADARNTRMGAPMHDVPIPYPPMQPRPLPSQALGTWHRQDSASEPKSGYSPWMYPNSSTGNAGNGSSEN